MARAALQAGINTVANTPNIQYAKLRTFSSSVYTLCTLIIYSRPKFGNATQAACHEEMNKEIDHHPTPRALNIAMLQVINTGTLWRIKAFKPEVFTSHQVLY